MNSQSVSISQLGLTPALSLSGNAYNANTAASSTTVDVVSNIDWTSSSDQSWLTCNPTSGNGNQTVTISWTENASLISRPGVITFSGTNVANKTFTVTQAGLTATLPVVSTEAVSNIGETDATVSLNVSNFGTGYTSLTNYGVCWSTTNQNPTITDNKIDKGTLSQTGTYSCDLTSLTQEKTYYVKAFATNGTGTAYGNLTTVKTKAYFYSNLIALYLFNGNANDESGNGNNAVYNNATLTSDHNGNANSAYNFNGTSQYINFGDINAIDGAAKISFCFLLNTENDIAIMSKGTPSIESSVINLLHSNATYNNPFWFNLMGSYNPGADRLDYMTNQSFSSNTWYHVVFIFDGTQSTVSNKIQIWVDGVKQSLNNTLAPYNAPFTSIPSNSQPVRLMSVFGGDGTQYFAKGKIDDFRIYNKVLSTNDIIQLYNATK